MTPEIEFLLHLTDFGIKLGLDKTLYLLDQFGNPHLKYPSVLIAGTNGKGSVAKTVANILTCAGYRTGLYTSPHLVDIGERVIFNGKMIEEEQMAYKVRCLQKILSLQPYHMCPTFFEALTVIAFSYFADMKADILVCEVGMGGRFDSTNVLPASIQVITKIGLEHTRYLGKTYEEIASEKAGIIKPRSIVVSASQKEPAMNVIRNKVKEKNSRLYTYGRDFFARRTSVSLEGQEFRFYSGKESFFPLKTPLIGTHQIENMALAIQTVRLLNKINLPVKKEALYEGMSTVSWPCRFQVLKQDPVIIIDGAHNPDGIRTLSITLADVFPEKRFSFLVGILKDKDWHTMLRILLKNNNIGEMVFTKPCTERALNPEILAGFVRRKKDIKITVIPDPISAFNDILKTDNNWCICGSLYLCGDILSTLPEKQI